MTISEQQAVPVAQLQTLQDWLREPDHAEHFGTSQLVEWINRRPTHIVPAVLASLAASSLHDMQITPELSHPCKSGEGAGEAFLDQLRRVNLARYEAWVEGADAGIMFDALELGGEVGELLNVVKKLEREERGWRGSRANPADFDDECADVMICLDKLARRRNVDLAAATIAKFNATSEKVGLPHRLTPSPAIPEGNSGDGVHPDDRAVDLFSARMKTKLAMAREKGRGGWDDPEQCSVAYLQQLLHEHIVKGDPVDVANFCMMLSHYDATTTLATVAAANDEAVARKWFPHLCWAGEPMHEGQFREPWPMDEERTALAKVIFDGWYEGNEDWDSPHNDHLQTRAYFAADAAIRLLPQGGGKA